MRGEDFWINNAWAMDNAIAEQRANSDAIRERAEREADEDRCEDDTDGTHAFYVASGQWEPGRCRCTTPNSDGQERGDHAGDAGGAA